jgi:hypothetical protein
MAFKMKTYKELVAMTKEKLDEALVPLRVRAAKAKAEGEVIKLEEKLISLETQINEACAKKEIDFNAIGDRIDEYELAERRLKQIQDLIKALFQGS